MQDHKRLCTQPFYQETAVQNGSCHVMASGLWL